MSCLGNPRIRTIARLDYDKCMQKANRVPPSARRFLLSAAIAPSAIPVLSRASGGSIGAQHDFAATILLISKCLIKIRALGRRCRLPADRSVEPILHLKAWGELTILGAKASAAVS